MLKTIAALRIRKQIARVEEDLACLQLALDIHRYENPSDGQTQLEMDRIQSVINDRNAALRAIKAQA